MKLCSSLTHAWTQWDTLWWLWVSEHLLTVRLFPSSWHKPPVTQGDLSTRSQHEQQCQNSRKKLWGKKSSRAKSSFAPSESHSKYCVEVLKRRRGFHHSCPAQDLRYTARRPQSCSDRLFSVSASEFIYSQSGGSPLGVWWWFFFFFWHPDKQMFRGHE